MCDVPEYEEYVEPVTYIQIGEQSVTKENLVAHLSHYEVGDKFKPFTIGSLSDDIGKMLHAQGIVEPLKESKSDSRAFSMATERVGWKDPDGKAEALYRELTVEEKTYKIRLEGSLKERAETKRDAQHAKALLERRNPDASVSIEVITNRVADMEGNDDTKLHE